MDMKRAFVTCVPILCVLLLTAGWKLATLEDGPGTTTVVDDPVARARSLYNEAKKRRDDDPATARALCDEAIAIIDSVRAASPDPDPGKEYPFEELYQRTVELKIAAR
jgi:hypothetical protein